MSMGVGGVLHPVPQETVISTRTPHVTRRFIRELLMWGIGFQLDPADPAHRRVGLNSSVTRSETRSNACRGHHVPWIETNPGGR